VLPRARVKVQVTTPTTELIINGGFETGDPPTGWLDVNATLASEAIEVFTGSASLAVIDTTGSGGGAYRSFTVVPGEVLTFTGYKKRKTAGSATRFAIYDVTNTTYVWNPSNVEDTGWTQYSHTFTVPAGCVELRIFCRVESSGDEAYFDALSLIGKTYDLFAGRIDKIKPSGKVGKKRVTITAYDAWKDFAGDVPVWLWLAALGGGAFILSRKFRKAEKVGTESYQDGSRR